MTNTSISAEYAQLKLHPLFKDLKQTEISEITESMQCSQLKKGQVIDFLNEPEQFVYILFHGTVKLCESSSEGNEYIKDFYQDNDLFGFLTENYGNEHFEYIEVISSRVVSCKVPLSVLTKVLRTNSDFSIRYNEYIWSQYRKIEKRYHNLSRFKNARKRLLHFFMDWAFQQGKTSNSGIVLKNYLTHKDLADLICCTRVTVTHALNELKHSGEIKYSRNRIEINDSVDLNNGN